MFVEPVSPTTDKETAEPAYKESWVRLPEGDKAKEIEEDIVRELVERHSKWIANGNGAAAAGSDASGRS